MKESEDGKNRENNASKRVWDDWTKLVLSEDVAGTQVFLRNYYGMSIQSVRDLFKIYKVVHRFYLSLTSFLESHSELLDRSLLWRASNHNNCFPYYDDGTSILELVRHCNFDLHSFVVFVARWLASDTNRSRFGLFQCQEILESYCAWFVADFMKLNDAIFLVVCELVKPDENKMEEFMMKKVSANFKKEKLK